jgi:hypothetical protein
MNKLNGTAILLMGQLLMACSQNKDTQQTEVGLEVVSETEVADDVPPPPPGFTTNFETLHEWLSHLCATEMPGDSIVVYHFGLFEAPDNYILYMVGSKDYQEGQAELNRIHFEPSAMYYRLSKSEYKGISRKQVVAHLTAQLKAFSQTGTFHTSYLAKASAITSDFGGTIWPQ